jgi:hypothetical protein
MRFIIVLAFLVVSISAHATDLKVTGLLDFYYAADFNSPNNIDRDYTTQAARDGEFNVNLASIGFSHQQGKLESHLAIQAGTSVQSNYAGEPTTGTISGGTLSRHIQEAYIKYKVNDKTTVQAGIFFSHIGNESFISPDNWTYTRSFASDYSPFYQSGVGVQHQLDKHFMIEGYLLNGWQNMSEDDQNKAASVGIKYTNGKLKINYTNFLGRANQEDRIFHDFNAQYDFDDKFRIKALYDFGQDDGGDKKFYTYNVQLQYDVSEKATIAFRYENYNDPDETNISSLGNGFEIQGISANYDYKLEENYLWRIEYRSLTAEDDIFNKDDKMADTNSVLLTSLAVQF